MNLNKLNVGSSPHIRNNVSTKILMTDFFIGLMPLLLVAFFVHKGTFINIILFSIVTALLLDKFFTKIFKLPEEEYSISSIITAVLLSLSFPSKIPLWVLFFGIFFALLVGKFVFGGLSQNLFNPALIGRIFLMFSFPQYVFNYKAIDGISGATTLQLLKYRGELFQGPVDYKSLFFGIDKSASLGEISFLALLFGFIYLSIRKRINFRYPLIMMATVFLSAFIFGKNPFYYLFSGGVIFSSIYFLTDPVSAPYTDLAKKNYALFVGIFVVIVREFTHHPEGVAYGILFGNTIAPLFNKLFKPRVFGRRRNMKEFYSLVKIILFSLACIFILNFFDKKYSARINIQKENILLKEMKKIIPEAEKFDLYEESKYYEGFLFIPAYDKTGKNIAYIVRGKSRGYSEKEIEFLLGIDKTGKTLGHKIIEHQETLGLGSKLSEKEYRDLWKNKDIDSKFIRELDAPSGATYTFLNFFKTVKEVLKIYNLKILAENNEAKIMEPVESGNMGGIKEETKESIINPSEVKQVKGQENKKTTDVSSEEDTLEIDADAGATETVVY